MLHIKFRGNRPAGSGEKDFLRVFSIYGRGGHLGHVTQMPRTIFVPPTQGGSTYNLALIGQAVSEEKTFDIVDRRTDGRRTDAGPWVSYRLTIEPNRLRLAKNENRCTNHTDSSQSMLNCSLHFEFLAPLQQMQTLILRR